MSHSSRLFTQLREAEEMNEGHSLANPFDLFYTEEREKQIGKRTCLSCGQDVTYTSNHKHQTHENNIPNQTLEHHNSFTGLCIPG